MKGLIVKNTWLNLIFEGKKTWEIRGRNVKFRGRICLIESGTKTVVGYADLVDCIPLTQEEYQSSVSKHCINNVTEFPYKKVYAWVLENPIRLSKPIPYDHPLGVVIWVNLPDTILLEKGA